MGIFGALDDEARKKLFKRNMDVGDVFLKDFDEADHQKFFIIAGMSTEKVFVCSVFINSAVHPSIMNKP